MIVRKIVMPFASSVGQRVARVDQRAALNSSFSCFRWSSSMYMLNDPFRAMRAVQVRMLAPRCVW